MTLEFAKGDGVATLYMAHQNRHVEIVSELQKKLKQSETSMQKEPEFRAKRRASFFS
jgi:hypothetical protein